MNEKKMEYLSLFVESYIIKDFLLNYSKLPNHFNNNKCMKLMLIAVLSMLEI